MIENDEYGISKVNLDKILSLKEEKYNKWLEEIKGVQGLMCLLKTDLREGIKNDEKTSNFFRRKILGCENTEKISLNNHNFYSTLLHSCLFFTLALLKYWKSGSEETKFLELFCLIALGIFYFIISFCKINDFTQYDSEENHMRNMKFQVLRKGSPTLIFFKDLLIGDIIILEEKRNMGSISGILAWGELEIIAKSFSSIVKIRMNDRFYPETTIISGKGLLLLTGFGKKSNEEKEPHFGLDNLTKIIYVVIENAGIFGRLVSWLAIMIWIAHCHFGGKFELLNFYDGATNVIISCAIFNPIVLIWILNKLSEKSENQQKTENGTRIRNIRNLTNVHSIVIDEKWLFQDKVMLQLISDGREIIQCETLKEIQKFKSQQNLLFFQKKIVEALSALIFTDQQFSSNTEKSIAEFLNMFYSDKLQEVKRTTLLKCPKNYKLVSDENNQCFYKLGDYEEIISECDSQIGGNSIVPLEKELLEGLLQTIESKDIKKILAISVTALERTTFLGFLGFQTTFLIGNENIPEILNKFEGLGIKIIIPSNRSIEDCQSLQQLLGSSIKELKSGEDFLENDISLQKSSIISDSNQLVLMKIVQILKDQDEKTILTVNENNIQFFENTKKGKEPLILASSSSNLQKTFNAEIHLSDKPLNSLFKSLILSLNLANKIKKALAIKTILSLGIGLSGIISFCILLQPWMTYEFILVTSFWDVLLVVSMYLSKDLSEKEILESKKLLNAEFLVQKKDVLEIFVSSMVNIFAIFLLNFAFSLFETAIILGIIILFAYNPKLSRAQFLAISLLSTLIYSLLGPGTR